MKTRFNWSASSRHGRCSVLVLLGLFFFAGQLQANSLKFIAISSTAHAGYVRPLDEHGKPRPESYVIMKGRYFGGNTSDQGLATVPFEDIVRQLSANLAKQNYFPAKDVPSSNLTLLVHWGITEAYDDPQKEFAADKMNAALSDYRAAAESNGGDADPTALNDAKNNNAYAQQSAEAAIARNAKLLGFKTTLDREQNKIFPSTEEWTMTVELNEARYFVIIVAYDNAYMKKEHKTRVLWDTRISVRSPGNNFNEAMPALAHAGAEAFGRQLDGVTRVNGNETGGRVDYGELKVMGTVESTPPAEKKK